MAPGEMHSWLCHRNIGPQHSVAFDAVAALPIAGCRCSAGLRPNAIRPSTGRRTRKIIVFLAASYRVFAPREMITCAT